MVERAGSSVGSLYHHFGGKSELFIALWHGYQQAQEASASAAVARAKQAGVTDPYALFSAGARGYLEGAWDRRDLSLLFNAGDWAARLRGHAAPARPGVDQPERHAAPGWPHVPANRLYVTVLTSLTGEGAREVAAAKNRPQANKIIEGVLEYIHRLMVGGPWSPPAEPAAGTA